MGNQTRAEWGIYPALDGWVGNLRVAAPVRNLFDAIGDPELTDGPFVDSLYPLEHPEELSAKLYLFTLSHACDELMDIARTRKVPSVWH
jgi:hypothetical protein